MFSNDVEVELSAKQRSAAPDGASTHHGSSEKKTAPLNYNATSAYTTLLKARQDELPESMARTLNRLSSALNAPVETISDTTASNSPYTKLSLQLIGRDDKLKEQMAQSLSTSRHFVRQRDAAAEFEANTKNLPPALQESCRGGSELAKFICEGLVSLSDPQNMGAGLERDLAVRGIYVPEQKLTLRARAAASEAIAASVAYIKSNQPEMLQELADKSAAQNLQPAANPADAAATAATANPDEIPQDKTYLDIFKQNRQHEQTDELSAQMSQRIRALITKAADTAKKGNLIPANGTEQPAVPEQTSITPQAAARQFQPAVHAKGADTPSDGSKISLTELAARASRLQQQFREERQRLAAEGKLPDPAPLPENPVNSAQQVLKNTLSPPTPAEQIDRAQQKLKLQQNLQQNVQAGSAPLSPAAQENLESSELLTAQALSRIKNQLASQAQLEEELAKSKAELLRTQQEIIKLQTDVAKMQEQTLLAAKETAAAQLKQQQLQLEAQQALNARTAQFIAAQHHLQQDPEPVADDSVKRPAAPADYALKELNLKQQPPAVSTNLAQPAAATAKEPPLKSQPVNAQNLYAALDNADTDKVPQAQPTKDPEPAAAATSGRQDTPETLPNADPEAEKLTSRESLKNTYDAIEAMLLDQTVPEDEGVSTKAAELRPAPAAQRPVPAEPGSQGGRVESRAAALYGAISATAKDQQPGQTSPQDEAAGHLPADGNEKTSNKAGSAAALIQDKGSLPIQDEGSIPPQDESQDQAELKLFSAKPAGNSAESEASASSDDSAISAAPATNAPAIAPAAAEQDQAAEDGLSQSAAGSKPAYNVANIPAADHEKSPDAASRLYQDSMASLNKNQAAPTAESKDTPEPASDGDETTPLPPKQPHSSAQAGNGADSDNSAAGAENKAASTQTQPPAAEEDGKIQPDTDRTESADSPKPQPAAEKTATPPNSTVPADPKPEDIAQPLPAEPENTVISSAPQNSGTDSSTDSSAGNISADNAKSGAAIPQPPLPPPAAPATDPNSSVGSYPSPDLELQAELLKNTGESSSNAAAFRQLYQGTLKSLNAEPGKMPAPALSDEWISAGEELPAAAVPPAALKEKVPETATQTAAPVQETVQNDPELTAADDVKAGLMRTLLSTVPGDDFKDEGTTATADSKTLASADAEVVPLKPALSAPGAAAITTGASAPLPELTQVAAKTAREGGLLRRIASFFSGRSANKSPVSSSDDLPALSSGALRGDPLQKLFSDLRQVLADPSLPAEVKAQADDFIGKLNAPVADLTAVNNWLNFVTGPLSPSSPQALALHQWAFLLLCIRFSQLNKDISRFVDKYKDEDPKLSARIEKAVAKAGKNSGISALIDDTFSQTLRLQQLSDPQGGLSQFFAGYVPLPPAYEGGSEGGFNLKREQDEDGHEIWHLNFFFDLKDLGPIQIKAEARLPELFLHIVTDSLEALTQVQQLLPLLREKLQDIGITTRQSNARLGHVFMPTAPLQAAGSGANRRDEMSQLSLDI